MCCYMQTIKELNTMELQKIIGGENDHRMPYELNRPNNLSKGGAKCAAGILGAGLGAVGGGPGGFISAGISAVLGCM